MNEIKFESVENKIIFVRNMQVILDCNVANLYGVTTKEINQAVKNNFDKFPEGYVFILDKSEKLEVVKKFDHLAKLKYSYQLLKKSGELIAEILDGDLLTNETETTIELNFAVLKFRHTLKKKKKIN